MSLVIVEYEDFFLEQVVQIFEQSLGEDRQSTLSCIEAHTNSKESRFWLSVEDKTVLGILAFSFEQWNNIGRVGMIGVSSASKGKGVGKSLMEQAKKHAKSVGLRKIYVDTDESNINAQIFYIKCGYFPEYSMKDYYEPGLAGITFSLYV